MVKEKAFVTKGERVAGLVDWHIIKGKGILSTVLEGSVTGGEREERRLETIEMSKVDDVKNGCIKESTGWFDTERIGDGVDVRDPPTGGTPYTNILRNQFESLNFVYC